MGARTYAMESVAGAVATGYSSQPIATRSLSLPVLTSCDQLDLLSADRVEEQRISRQRLAPILWAKAEENNAALA